MGADHPREHGMITLQTPVVMVLSPVITPPCVHVLAVANRVSVHTVIWDECSGTDTGDCSDDD